ncbi:hypothetical protein CJ030_MR8G025877 [Morella rubra]|uniref:Uncharacterized protein n=1 Tax=Morella rubra TaxID=262757 RepID=A0A6A1UUS8_9ROSI|nr:hypothetical protein CJ030_MR8G025877 [Morella rubra]
MAQAPLNFSPTKIIKSSKFFLQFDCGEQSLRDVLPETLTYCFSTLNVNWFPPAEASLKRSLIQRLIFELLERHSPEVSSAGCSDEDEPSDFPANNKNETCMEFFSERCGPAMAHQGNISNPQAGSGIEMTLLSASSMNSQCVNNSGLVLKEFLESGATAGSLFGQYPSFDHPSSYYRLNGAISPSEEDVENSDRFIYLASGDAGFQQMVGIAPQARSIPYSSRAFGAETSYNLGISVQEEHGNLDSSLEPSNCASDDSDVGITNNFPVGEDVGKSQKEDADEQRTQSTGNMECLSESLVAAANKLLDTSSVEASEESDKMHNGKRNRDCLPTGQENCISLQQDTDLLGNGEVPCDNLLMTGDDEVAESYEQEAAKRLRLTPCEEVGYDSVLTTGDDQVAGSYGQ